MTTNKNPPPRTDAPTVEFYRVLQTAFDHFNATLFDGVLPPCLITLRSASRVYGYHHAQRFVSPAGEHIDELGLHPGFFTLRPVEAVLSTLVHEMAHHWQEHFGTPSASNAHNREWAVKMESLGLMPSHTGLPGGTKTGRTVSHYILPEGLFLLACRKLLENGFQIPWLDRHAPMEPERMEERQRTLAEAGVVFDASPPPVATLPERADGSPAVIPPPPKRAPSREKFTCPDCGIKAWATPGTEILCGKCAILMTGEGRDN